MTMMRVQVISETSINLERYAQIIVDELADWINKYVTKTYINSPKRDVYNDWQFLSSINTKYTSTGNKIYNVPAEYNKQIKEYVIAELSEQFPKMTFSMGNVNNLNEFFWKYNE